MSALTLRVHDTVEHVAQSLDLSPVDAATYVRLCMGGPWKVSELAAALEVHRNDVYRSLERLGARGLVATTLENPARYIAADPLKTFEMELDRRAAAVEALQKARERMVELVLGMRDAAQVPRKAAYGIVQGRQEISACRRRMIAEAQEEILVLTTSPHALATAEFDGTIDALVARRGGKVQMRLLLNVPDDELRRVGLAPASEGLEARRAETPVSIHFLLVDGKEILLSVVEDPSRSLYAQGDVAMLTEAAGLLEAERVFFNQCWANAPHPPGEAPVRTLGAGSPL